MPFAAGTWGVLSRINGPFGRVASLNQPVEKAAVNPQLELVRRAQSGDLAAFEQLFSAHQRGVYNVVFQMVRNDSDASDITQEVFLRVWRSLPRLTAPEAFVSWMYRIATNYTRNWIRDHTRVRVESLDQPRPGDDEDGGGREIPDFRANPADSVQVDHVRTSVHRAIEGLSEDHKMVVTLHHLEGVPVEEVAQIMRCSVGTVKSRLSRAREALRRRLAGLVEN